MMPPVSQGPSEVSEAHAEKIIALVMRRQLALSLQVASVFFLLLFGLPLVNTYFPDMANTVVFGFTLTWLLLGVAVFPVTVLLAYYFVRNSDRIETECTEAIAAESAGKGGVGA